jgi:hypothetical protein
MNLIKKFKSLTFIDSKFNFPLGSYPFISGDSFKLISDIIYSNNKKFIIGNSDNVIFSDINSLNLLEYDIDNLNYRNKKIIIHNGDDPPSNVLRKKIYSNNCLLYSTNITKMFNNENVIPIGIENYHFNNNGSPHYYNFNLLNKNFNKDKCTLLSFNVNTNFKERFRIKNISEKYGLTLNFPIPTEKYRKILSRSRFIICPPGNGIDTHRFWEAIYHKSIPVIERKDYLFHDLDLPVYCVDDFEDFFKLNDFDKKLVFEKIFFKKSLSIYMNYWINKIYGN